MHDPILVKCGMLTQNDMTITAMRSKSKLKKIRTENEKLLIGRAGNKSGIIQCIRACVFAGVVQLHNLLNCGTGILYAQLAGRFYGYTAEMTGSVSLKL